MVEEALDAGPRTVRRLMHEARFGALATVEGEGGPYASLVAVAPDAEGAPLLLLSQLARHTRNFRADSRVSLMLAGVGGADPLNSPRVSLIGTIAQVTDAEARTRYLARHPEAEGYADFADFAFYRVAVAEAHLVEGFGRILTLPGAAVLADWSGADAVRAAEAGIIAHMNEDHADANALYATRLLGDEDGSWRMISLDPAGCDLQLATAAGTKVRRLEFSAPVLSVAAVRQALVDLVRTAKT